jgi:hypothetical protein
VDLGTSAKKADYKAAHKELVHRDDKTQIDELTKNYTNAVANHEIALKSVHKTQVELDWYGEQLKQIKSAHEDSVNAEKEKKAAEALTKQKAQDAESAYQTMKDKMADLHSAGAGLHGLKG